MRLILDLVYLHIGPDADILHTHPEFAKQYPDGSFVNGRWNFPLLDFNHPGLREYLWSNMVYYIASLDADGFRCDVGDGVPLDFWAEGLRVLPPALKEVAYLRLYKPEASLTEIGESLSPPVGKAAISKRFAKLRALAEGEQNGKE